MDVKIRERLLKCAAGHLQIRGGLATWNPRSYEQKTICLRNDMRRKASGIFSLQALEQLLMPNLCRLVPGEFMLMPTLCAQGCKSGLDFGFYSCALKKIYISPKSDLQWPVVLFSPAPIRKPVFLFRFLFKMKCTSQNFLFYLNLFQVLQAHRITNA